MQLTFKLQSTQITRAVLKIHPFTSNLMTRVVLFKLIIVISQNHRIAGVGRHI